MKSSKRKTFLADGSAFAELLAHAKAESDGNKALEENYVFHGLYGYDTGVAQRVLSTGRRRPLTDHEFMEKMLRIRPKDPERVGLLPFKLNQEQRYVEAQVLKMQRAGVPVRIIILKPRQIGLSTYVEGRIFTRMSRSKHFRGLIVAHRNDTSKLLLKMSRIMLRNMPKEGESRWKLKTRKSSTYEIAIDEPIEGEFEVSSSQTEDPGHGDTCQVVQLSEVGLWENAEETAKGVLQILPNLPGTMAFMESTAKGDHGYFRDMFWAAWQQRHLPFEERSSAWHPIFFPWFFHEEYRWTKTTGRGRALPKAIVENIKATITEEEEFLLEQSYHRRGYGLVKVDYDQLAWRRKQIDSQLGGSLDKFHEQYPSTPEEAFLASGQPCFDTDKLQRMSKMLARDPLYRADLLPAAHEIRSQRLPAFIPQMHQAEVLPYDRDRLDREHED